MNTLRLVSISILLVGFTLVGLVSGCSVDSAKNHYILAEKLWTDRKYSAAVSEFEKVITKDPRGKLGTQAMYRAAMTQYLFLGQFGDAVRKFKNFTQDSSDINLVWDAQLQIGEILFSKTEQYDQAIVHYRSLLQQKPKAPEAPELLFRIAKSHFYLFQFNEAISTFSEIIKNYPTSPWAEKASFEIGATYFTRGEQGNEDKDSDSDPYQDAIQAYRKFILKYPKSDLVPQASFGVASCLEELDQLEEALQAYETLKKTYPSPNVVEIKLIRIRERMAQRKASH